MTINPCLHPHMHVMCIQFTGSSAVCGGAADDRRSAGGTAIAVVANCTIVQLYASISQGALQCAGTLLMAVGAQEEPVWALLHATACRYLADLVRLLHANMQE